MRAALSIVCLCLIGVPASGASAAPHYVITGATPGFVPSATRLGASDPAATIDLTIWLTMENRAALDALVAKEYDPKSSLYHHWTDRRKLGTLFGASETKVAAVQQFLQRNGLTIVGADPGHFYLRARGTAASVARAFNVELANFAYRGQVYRSNTADPVIEDEAGAYVSAIQGLSNMGLHAATVAQPYPVHQPANAAMRPADSGAEGKGPFEAVCFSGTTTETVTGGGYKGIYTGNLLATGTAGCGYSPPEIWTAFGLSSLYTKGYDGTGQTVAIIGWCLPSTLLKDANAFSTKYGLPALVLNQNISFQYYQSPGGGCLPTGVEAQLSVEWTHAIAPGAHIEIWVAPAPPYLPIYVDPTLLDAVENSGANVISYDFAGEESTNDVRDEEVENSIAEVAAVAGVALNVPSGDEGDYTYDQPQLYTSDVSVPADSPYVTAVGGASLGLNASGAIQFQAGWGTNLSQLFSSEVYREGFQFGSGGGKSSVFAAPAFQQGLNSAYRQVPDIAWLADPYTGAIVAQSVPDAEPTLQYNAYGGTGVATYMFSALWAIADQAAGHSLGQAAPFLYAAKAGVVTDVVPVGSKADVTGNIFGPDGYKYHYTLPFISGPLEKTKVFYSALYNAPLYQDTVYAVSFGTDTGLNTSRGWDPVTGLGVPDPVALIKSVIQSRSAGGP
jgi:subtilase family serine protease